MLKDIFNLKYQVRVKYVPKLTWGKKKIPCMGIYEWDSSKKVHVIKIDYSAIHSEYMNTLAHEYIHAWQCEMGLKLSHGRVFKWWAEYLKPHGYCIAEFQ